LPFRIAYCVQVELKKLERPERQKLAIADLVSKCFGILMVVLYFIIGTTIIFRAPEMRNIPQHYAIIFGILLILYGIFRAYKLYQKYFSKAAD
jgi:hypothetical protein